MYYCKRLYICISYSSVNSVKLSKLLSPADSAPRSALVIFSASPPHYAGNPTVCVGVHCHMTGWTHIYTLPRSLTPSPFYSPSLPHSLSSPTPLPLLPNSLTPPPLPLPPHPPAVGSTKSPVVVAFSLTS